MKLFHKLLLIALIWGVSSCELTDLDLQDNPNAVSPDQASVGDIFNRIQLDFKDFYNANWRFGGTLARMVHTTAGFTYQDFFSPSDFNFIWTEAYARIFPDIDALLAIAAERGLDVHAGIAKILKAYVLVTLVDTFGDVPLTEAGQGSENFGPKDDPGQDVYAAAEAMLDDAIAQLSNTVAAPPTNDIYYGGDVAKWITLAKTMKLKMAVTTRRVDSKAKDKINALIAEGDLIDEASEDFEFKYGTNRTNPNSRHPFYNEHYESSDGGYMSNYFMWLMRAEKVDDDGNFVIDPRIRFYFYRQVRDAAAQNVNVYSCIHSDLPDPAMKPQHYIDVDPNLPYCIVLPGDGYYGRDHLNGSGIPPDGPIRTVHGLYPGGGKFDDNSFGNVQNQGTDGGLGAGINPIILSSFVDFWRAEAAITLGTNDDPRALLESGVRKSIDKVFSFKSLVSADMAREITDPITGEVRTVEELFVPSDSTVNAYVDFVLNRYDNASSDEERLDVVMKEFLIALWGNGIEAYNNYRRTGMPLKIQPCIDPACGEFARSAFYPAVHVDFNQNATQKSITDPVWWDPGDLNLY